MSKGTVCVFGANGFLGHFVVRRLAKDGWRVRACVRRPHISGDLRVMGSVGQIQIIQANVRYKKSVAQAVVGCDAVINLCGIVVEQGRQSFNAVHVLGAKNVAEAARDNGITNVVHMSALGADLDANSAYAHSRAKGEQDVHALVPSAALMRPSILFGEGDGFFTRFAKLANMSLALPLIGGGKTKLAPVYADDLAQAVCTIIAKGSAGKTWEIVGPRVYSFKELLQIVLGSINKNRLLVPLPWALSSTLGMFGELSGYIPLVSPFLTRDQVKALRNDTVASGEHPGLLDLGITPETVEVIVPPTLSHFRKYGQFHETDIAPKVG